MFIIIVFFIVKWIYFAFNDYNFILLYVIIKTFYAITVIYQSMIFFLLYVDFHSNSNN